MLDSLVEPLEELARGSSGQLRFKNPLERRAIEVKPVVFPTSPSAAERAYWVLLDVATGRTYELVVSAVDGRLLYRHNLLRQAASGRVWPKSPVAGERELLDFPAGWLPEQRTTTSGTNADVYLDWNGDGVPGDIHLGIFDSRSWFPDPRHRRSGTG